MTSALRRMVRSPRTDDAVLRAVDAVAAAVFIGFYVFFAGLGSGELAPSQPYYSGPTWLGWLIAVGVGAPIAVRRRWPEAAWAVSSTALVVATALHVTLEPWLPAAITLYTVALRSSWRRAVTVLAVTLLAAAVTLALTATGSAAEISGLIVYVWMISGSAWVGGVIVRERRAGAAERRRRDAEQALSEERLQIARELHDVVAHSMSLIAVQAGVANHVVAQRPEAAQDALRVIEATSRNALTDIRRLLGVLRTPDAEFAPTPGLDALPALVDRAVAGGVGVDLRVAVDSRSYSDAVQLVAYRIVQEGLTNVVKHAGPTDCRVELSERNGVLEVCVENERASAPAPRPAPPGGHGLVGLRERVGLFGGELVAAPRPSGGFRLVATLPVGSE
ncbi:sensor histidine kinase [Cryptosporangium aurantiacum]|uniref:sensor histidine kinase n=1 Tax=Cryptosporangium aurantiacum TaxID=134849 RepID=UPI0015BA16B5|nr:histidine kinase [Cryptosporangium aurantiacum]